jgi:16S rRNA (uracil1498-N3)-methyltransferase
MPRRVHLPNLTPGEIELPARQAHHVRDVLRLKAGAAVRLFDDGGATADGSIVRVTPAEVLVMVGSIEPALEPGFAWSVASAVPKAARADWMVEKLSELGTAALIPLATARSVVLPEGEGKLGRWARLAAEAARQSGRAGVMRIEPLTAVADLVSDLLACGVGSNAWYFSTTASAVPIATVLARPRPEALTLFVGPEGGWTDAEIAAFDGAGMIGVKLTDTVLRIETAAITASALVACGWGHSRHHAGV